MDEDTATELAARIEALKELGPEHEQELVAGFVDQLDKEIDRRIDERLAKLPAPRRQSRRVREAELGVFIPIFIFAGVFGHALGIVAAAILFAGVVVSSLWTRRLPTRLELRKLAPAGLLFGISYICLFEAYWRGRVTVVSPLVATESLFGVALAALLIRHTEGMGRRIAVGALLVVIGGAIIGASAG